MNARTKKYLWLAVRILVSVLCVAWVLARVDFADRIDVATERGTETYHGWIVSKTEQAVTFEHAGGETRSYPMSQIARDKTGAPIVAEGLKHDFSDVFSKGRWPWFAAAVLVALIPLLFGTWRWQMLLRIQNIHLTFGEAWRLTYIGSFFNTFMLGMTGGDVVKAYYVAKRTERKAEAVTTVFLDRGIGVFGLGLLCALALTVRWSEPALSEARGIILIFLGGCLAAGLVFYSRRLRRWLLLGKVLSVLPFRPLVRRLDSAVFIYRFHKGVLLLTIGQSLAAHAANVACAYLAARALDVDISPLYFAVYMPTIWILAAFFPSVGAFGVLEGWTQHFFTAGVLGVGTTLGARGLALAMALLFRAAQFVAVLPGGILNIVHPEVSVKEAERQIDEGVI